MGSFGDGLLTTTVPPAVAVAGSSLRCTVTQTLPSATTSDCGLPPIAPPVR